MLDKFLKIVYNTFCILYGDDFLFLGKEAMRVMVAASNRNLIGIMVRMIVLSEAVSEVTEVSNNTPLEKIGVNKERLVERLNQTFGTSVNGVWKDSLSTVGSAIICVRWHRATPRDKRDRRKK